MLGRDLVHLVFSRDWQIRDNGEHHTLERVMARVYCNGACAVPMGSVLTTYNVDCSVVRLGVVPGNYFVMLVSQRNELL